MKQAVCNELFGDLDFKSSLAILRKTGFSGVEIAPHTLFGDFSGNNKGTLTETARVLNGEGIAFAGLHWLLVGPEGLHVTSSDEKIRNKSWDHIRRLADIGGELGGGPMTFGSPAQRSSGDNLSTAQAVEYFYEGLDSVADYTAETGCRLLVEALPSEFTDVVNTLAEARTVIDQVGKSGVGGMFDFHNTDDETEDWPTVIQAHGSYIAHVHLNDEGGTVPRGLRQEYRDSFRVLNGLGYEDWISLEIFSIPPNPEETLMEVKRFLDEIEKEEQE